MEANATSSPLAGALPFNLTDPAEVQEVLNLLLAGVRSQLPPLQNTFGAYLVCTFLGCMYVYRPA